MQSLAESLVAIRRAQGEDAQALAARAEVSPTYLSRLERGRAKPKGLAAVEKIGEIYGVPRERVLALLLAEEGWDLEALSLHISDLGA